MKTSFFCGDALCKSPVVVTDDGGPWPCDQCGAQLIVEDHPAWSDEEREHPHTTLMRQLGARRVPARSVDVRSALADPLVTASPADEARLPAPTPASTAPCPNCLRVLPGDAERCRCGYQFSGYVSPVTLEDEFHVRNDLRDWRAQEGEKGEGPKARAYAAPGRSSHPGEIDRASKGALLLVLGVVLTVTSFAFSEVLGYAVIFTGLIGGGASMALGLRGKDD